MLTRDKSIDALKGFAMILVVTGHILQNSLVNYQSNFLFKYIYSFHMPLFIFLSGYVAYKTDFNNSLFIKLKIIQLLIPYFVWMVISSLLFMIFSNANFIDSLTKKIIFPDNGLWFLWVLFFMHCGYTLYRKSRIIMITVYMLSVVLILVFKNTPNYLEYKTIIIYFIYYMMGVFTKKHINKLSAIINIRVIGVMILGISIFLVFPSKNIEIF